VIVLNYSKASLITKANANYTCSLCGATERIQSHHRIPKDDLTLISLCAICHHKQHPKMALGLFTSNVQQPYWHNKSMSTIAREMGVCSRTIARIVKRLDIPRGVLLEYDEDRIRGSIRKGNGKVEIIKTMYSKYYRNGEQIEREYCPYCNSWIPLVKAGIAYGEKGNACQRWMCRNKSCRKYTIVPTSLYFVAIVV
jgi:hypothetical protein